MLLYYVIVYDPRRFFLFGVKLTPAMGGPRISRPGES